METFLGRRDRGSSRVQIIERCGKFTTIAQPGLSFMVPCCDVPTSAISMRLQQIEVGCETKTKDNVFTHMKARIHARPSRCPPPTPPPPRSCGAAWAGRPPAAGSAEPTHRSAVAMPIALCAPNHGGVPCRALSGCPVGVPSRVALLGCPVGVPCWGALLGCPDPPPPPVLDPPPFPPFARPSRRPSDLLRSISRAPPHPPNPLRPPISRAAAAAAAGQVSIQFQIVKDDDSIYKAYYRLTK